MVMNRVYRVGNGVLAAFGLAAVLAVGGVWLQLAGDDAGVLITLSVVGGMLLLVALVGAWLVRTATIVDARGITIRGMYRSTRLLWPEVQELRVEENPSAAFNSDIPAENVYVYDRSAKRHALPHLNGKSVGPGFTYEIRRIRETWERQRGADWRPTPRVVSDVAERERFGASPWLTAIPFAVLGVFVGMGIMFVGMYAGWSVFGPWSMAVTPVVLYAGVVLWGLRRRRRARPRT